MSLDWTTKSDAEGRFVWDSAPWDLILCTLTKPGFVMAGQREFRAGPNEMLVTMYPPLRVRGKVVDAKSGQPIPRFTVVDGNYYRFSNRDGKLGQVNWDRGGMVRNFTKGHYEAEYAHPLVAAVAVRIEAEGYLPATSEPFKMEAGDVSFDVKLERGSGPSGVVRGPDGRPLAGATVVLSTRSLRAQLYNGKFHETGYPQVITGRDGQFSFPAQTEPYRLFTYHEKGFAEADQKTFMELPDLTLHSWGRVEGTVKIGARPAAGVQVRLNEIDGGGPADVALPITQAQQQSSDSRGHYAFEHVIPAELSVSRLFTLDRSVHHVGTGEWRAIKVEPDRTTYVDLGGTGRPVIGRFVLPPGIKAGAVFPYFFQTLTRILPDPPYPEGLSEQDRQAWLVQWTTSDAGKTYERSRRTYDTNVRADGLFRVEDVPAGKYEIQAVVHEPGDGIPGNYGPMLAKISREITVPEMPGGRSDEPLDLGRIELEPVKPGR